MASKLYGYFVINNQNNALCKSGKLRDKERVVKMQAQAYDHQERLRNSTFPKLTTSVVSTSPFTIATSVRRHRHRHQVPKAQPSKLEEKFGEFGGKFVPETLITSLNQLEAEFIKVRQDEDFKEELEEALRDYVGRETPLYHARRLTEFYKNNNGGKGPDIFLKREDLCHAGSHKMNNALGQAMIAKRLGLRLVVTATASGHHGIATASACAKLGLNCKIFMAAKDMEQQHSNVQLMTLFGAQVEKVEGQFKEALADATRNWAGNMEKSYHLTGTAVGPHPLPTIVRHFQSVIGRETRRQALEKWGGKPHALVACVGTGSNALGLFHEFVGDSDVRLIGVEAAGLGLESGRHAATLSMGEVGVYHGAMTYLLQDDDGQTLEPYSIAVGMKYPAVGPELSHFKEIGCAEFHAVTDQQALDAYERVCELEGICVSLEASHAFGILDKLFPTFPNGGKIVVSCSSNGDEDLDIVFKHKQLNLMDHYSL